MNNLIKRLNGIEQQVQWIERALEQGEHIGTGLTLIVNLGLELDEDGEESSLWNRAGTPKQVALEVSYDTEELLGMLKHSLLKSLHQTKVLLRKEYDEAAAVLRTLEALP